MQKTFSCVNCSHEYTVGTPDDRYTVALLTPCDKKDYKVTYHDCENCSQRIALYWHDPTSPCVYPFVFLKGYLKEEE